MAETSLYLSTYQIKALLGFFSNPTPVRNVSQPVAPAPTSAPAPAPAPSNNCNPGVTNVEYQGKWYFVQWKNRAATKYTWSGAKVNYRANPI